MLHAMRMLSGVSLLVMALAAPTAAAADAPAGGGAGVAETDDDARRRILRVVIMDFEVGEGIDKGIARIVADNVVVEVRKVDGLSVVGMAEVRAMLAAESDRQLMGCAEGTSCLAEIADALGADILLTGAISRLDAGTVLSMRRIDQARAAVVGQVEERLKGAGGEELLAAVGPAIEKLFPELPLRVGATRGVPPERARVLNPPPLPAWSTTTVAIVAGGVAVAGIASGIASTLVLSDVQADVDNSAKEPVDGSSVVAGAATATGLATVANVAFVSAIVIGAGAGVMGLFTDWDDLAGQKARALAE
jgi:hypothetical protein